MSSINESLNKRFQMWTHQASLEKQEIINLKNKKMREYFKITIKERQSDKIYFQD